LTAIQSGTARWLGVSSAAKETCGARGLFHRFNPPSWPGLFAATRALSARRRLRGEERAARVQQAVVATQAHNHSE